MKKIIYTVASLLVFHATSFAQCDKNLVIQSSKTEYLDTANVVERTVDENTIIEISNKEMVIKPGDKTMTAVIDANTCNWKIPFKEGNTTYNVTFNDDQGNARKATISIEGKNEKLVLMVHTEGMSNIIRVPIDKFEEKKDGN